MTNLSYLSYLSYHWFKSSQIWINDAFCKIDARHLSHMFRMLDEVKVFGKGHMFMKINELI